MQLLLYNHLTQQDEQRRNDHINLCLSRSEHGKSAKRSINDFFSKKGSLPPKSSTPSLKVSTKSVPSAHVVKTDSSSKRGAHKLSKLKRMSRQQKAAQKEEEPIDVPNSIMVLL